MAQHGDKAWCNSTIPIRNSSKDSVNQQTQRKYQPTKLCEINLVSYNCRNTTFAWSNSSRWEIYSQLSWSNTAPPIERTRNNQAEAAPMWSALAPRVSHAQCVGGSDQAEVRRTLHHSVRHTPRERDCTVCPPLPEQPADVQRRPEPTACRRKTTTKYDSLPAKSRFRSQRSFDIKTATVWRQEKAGDLETVIQLNERKFKKQEGHPERKCRLALPSNDNNTRALRPRRKGCKVI